MNVSNVLRFCFLVSIWFPCSAEQSCIVVPCEKNDHGMDYRKTDNIDDIDIDQLIENYKKYEYFLAQLGLLHELKPSTIGRLLNYISVPTGLGCFWATLILLMDTDDYKDNIIVKNLPSLTKEQAWVVSYLVGLGVYLLVQFSRDRYIESVDYNRTRAAFGALKKDWGRLTADIPEEMRPVLNLLQQFHKADGSIDLDDRLLSALAKEMTRKYKKTATKIRYKIARCNKREQASTEKT